MFGHRTNTLPGTPDLHQEMESKIRTHWQLMTTYVIGHVA